MDGNGSGSGIPGVGVARAGVLRAGCGVEPDAVCCTPFEAASVMTVSATVACVEELDSLMDGGGACPSDGGFVWSAMAAASGR